ncbi:MAG: class B sortase [Clostridia bacterium]|nr:class B sortase [Clostridia bacterium]
MLKKIVRRALVLLFLVGVGGIAVQNLSYLLAERAHAEAEALAGVTMPVIAETEAETVPETETAETESETEPETEPEVPETEPETETETAVSETEAPETETETETQAPETEPETETEVPETEPETETQAPETEPETETAPPETEPAETEPEIDEYAQQLLATDLAPLREKNDDVIGWIAVPGTYISYPLMQGEDNTHYLYYSWEGWWNWSGSIYLDYRSSSDFTDFHSIIYGHRMSNDTMFNALKNFADPTFAAENPSVYILTEDGVRRYDVFAAYETAVDGTHSYRLGLEKPEDQQKFIDYCRRNSAISTDLAPSSEDGDRILTLSTCAVSGDMDYRWVVHFVLAYEELPKE